MYLPSEKRIWKFANVTSGQSGSSIDLVNQPPLLGTRYTLFFLIYIFSMMTIHFPHFHLLEWSIIFFDTLSLARVSWKASRDLSHKAATPAHKWWTWLTNVDSGCCCQEWFCVISSSPKHFDWIQGLAFRYASVRCRGAGTHWLKKGLKSELFTLQVFCWCVRSSAVIIWKASSNQNVYILFLWAVQNELLPPLNSYSR